MLTLVAIALAFDGTLDARLSELEKRMAALAPGQFASDQHKEAVRAGAAAGEVTKQSSKGNVTKQALSSSIKLYQISGGWYRGKIWAANQDCRVCGLEWSGSESGGEHNARFDCGDDSHAGSGDLAAARVSDELASARGGEAGEVTRLAQFILGGVRVSRPLAERRGGACDRPALEPLARG